MIYDDLPIKNDDFEFATLDSQRASPLFGHSRVAEQRATHQIPLESRKIPSKLRGGNLMGTPALKSVGENPKPTGTFRPGAEGTEKSRNFTQTKGFEMSTFGHSDNHAAATLENLRKEGTKGTHCTVQCWILSD